jgi:uncharacterized protein YllA (UPF0747 family)
LPKTKRLTNEDIWKASFPDAANKYTKQNALNLLKRWQAAPQETQQHFYELGRRSSALWPKFSKVQRAPYTDLNTAQHRIRRALAQRQVQRDEILKEGYEGEEEEYTDE